MNLRTFLGFAPPIQLQLPLGPPPLLRPRKPAPPKVAAVPRPTPDSEVSAALGKALTARLGETVFVEIHDNRSTMVSFRRHDGTLRVRLHHMFLPPVPALPGILSDFVSGRGRRRVDAGRWLDSWIKDHQAAIRPSRPPSLSERPGRCHDLAAIFTTLNQRFFDNTVDAEIGWGRAPQKRRRRTIKMGVYLHDHRQIRIHPALDHEDVPDYFVAFVIYHEMCHQVCPPESTGKGRSRVHTKSFKQREQLYPDRDKALAWEKAHLGKLLRRT